jgi:hypothetical protein
MDRQDPCHAAGPLRTSLSSERNIQKKIWEVPCRISLTFNAIIFFSNMGQLPPVARNMTLAVEVKNTRKRYCKKVARSVCRRGLMADNGCERVSWPPLQVLLQPLVLSYQRPEISTKPNSERSGRLFSYVPRQPQKVCLLLSFVP